MLEREFKETIDKYNMINKNDSVLLAVSGGADSICMMHLLNNIKEKYNLKLVVLHINHGLRGKDSNCDEKFVSYMAKELGLPIVTEKIKIKGKNSIEERARILRYEVYEKISKKFRIDKIALGHNADDQVETMLMWMLRGTGLEGFSGMPYKRLLSTNSNAVIIRPILKLFRKDIEYYLKKHKMAYQIDKTNLETNFQRNKIRLNLIPYMEKYNKNTKKHLFNLSNIIKEEKDYFDELVEGILSKILKEKQGDYIVIDLQKYLVYNKVLQKKIIYRILNGNVNWKQLEDVLDIIHKDGNFEVSLNKNLMLQKEYDKLIIKNKNIIINKKNTKIDFKLNKIVKVDKYIFKSSILDKRELNNIKSKAKKNSHKVFFDYSFLKNKKLFYRYWNKGDRFIPFGLTGSKKLQDLFSDLKIPKNERHKIPILMANNTIVWIAGLRSSDKYKVTNKTKEMLYIEIMRNE